MPFAPGTNPADLGAPGRFPEMAPAPETPSALDTLAAAERQSNIVGTLYDLSTDPKPGKVSEGYDPLAHVPAGYEPHADKFVDMQSPEQVDWMKRRIDSETADRDTLARAGKWGTAASMAAGMTDPLTIASMAIPVGGATRLASAGKLALVAGGTTAVQEALQQQLTVMRTPEESALNVAGSTILGGLLGAALHTRVPARTRESLGNRISEEVHNEDGGDKVLGPSQRMAVDTALPSDAPHAKAEPLVEKPPEEVKPEKAETKETKPEEAANEDFHPLPGEHDYVNPYAESTAGAAQVAGTTLAQEGVAKGAKTVAEGYIGKVSPSLRVLTSASVAARRLVQELVNIPERLAKNMDLIKTAQPVERDLWGYDGTWWQGLKARADLFRQYRTRMKEEGGERLSRSQFNEQVSAAMRRGDQHTVPEIAKAAQTTRSIVFQPLYERAQKLGMLPDEAKLYADSYLTRQYDTVKIGKNFNQWMDTLTGHFQSKGIDHAEALDFAHQVTHRIRSGEYNTMDWRVLDGLVPKSGRVKARELTLGDAHLEPFLNNDIDSLSHSYLHSMAPEVEMTERFGSRDLKDQLDEVVDDYARQIEKARFSGGDPEALMKERDSTIEDLQGMRDRLYGIKGAPKDPGSFFVRAGRFLRAGNAVRFLGAATLAHFPDIANVIMRYGTGNTFSAIGRLLSDFDTLKLSANEARRMGAAVDMAMNVATALGDYGSHSRYAEQRVMAKVTRAFTIGTGETPLITAVQALTSTLAQHEIVGAAQRTVSGQGVNKALGSRLAAAGLDEPMLRRIAAEAEQHGMKANGLKFGGSDRWTDREAARAFESAVLRDAHGVTLRPGAGDTPFLMSTELGKAILQFKSFGFAASRTVVNPLLQGLANGELRSMEGLFALMTMGAISYASKQKAAGQPIEFNHPVKLAAEVMDKSNLMGWTADFAFPALWTMGYKDMAPWYASNFADTVGGPTGGLLKDLWDRQIPARLTSKEGEKQEFRRSDLHFIRRMAAGNGPWYLRQALDHLEDAIGDSFDLPGKSNRERAEESETK